MCQLLLIKQNPFSKVKRCQFVNKWIRTAVVASIGLLCCFNYASAANPVAAPFSPSLGKLYLTPHISRFVSENQIPGEDIVSGKYDDQFTVPRNAYLTQDKNNWFRFTVENTSSNVSDWVLELDSAMITSAELVFRQSDGTVHRQITGLDYGFKTRPIPFNTFALPVSQDSGVTQTYYLRITTPFQLYFSPVLVDYATFIEDAGISFSLPHLFIGLLMGVFVYLMVLSLGTASELMVHRYVWFVLFAMLIILYVNGFLMRYLPQQSWLSTRLWVLLHIGLQISYLRTTQSYFHTKENYPGINKYLSICVYISFSFFILLLTLPYSLLVKIELWYVSQMVIAMTMISCYIWLKEKRQVELFVIGNIGLLITAAMSTFAAVSNLTASDWLVKHGYELGFCWQAILFTWALSQKINELATSTIAAKAESKAKSEFIAKMSHEIRTPMNGVLGMTQLLHNTSINDEQKHYLNVIESSGKTLLAVINDILDYSKLMAGKTELIPHNFNLEQMLAELNTLFGDLAHSKHLSFNIIVSPDTPLDLFGDSVRLRQILTNLLSNAFKFTDHGLVVLKVKPLIQTPDHNNIAHGELRTIALQFCIRDTGIGITQEDQKQLFQNFSQVDAISSRRYGGTGLGLSICKQFVEMMGGNISVSSHLGEGTEFTFNIRMQLADINKTTATENTHSLSSHSNQRLNILVAEDDAINQDVLAGFLNKMEFNADFVFNGKEVIEKLNNPHLHYDLILMDCEMPVMDGIAACRAIRNTEKSNNKTAIPIVALTAHTSPDYLKHCKEEGMTDHLCKPISYEQLRNTIQRFTS